MFEDAHDNMALTDPETGDQLIFHRKTWLCTIHGILTRYLGFTPELAYDIIKMPHYALTQVLTTILWACSATTKNTTGL